MLFTSPSNGHIRSSSPARPNSPPYEIKPDITDIDGLPPQLDGREDDPGSSSEEENPFEAFAMTQASQGADIKVEVNSRVIHRDVINEDDNDDEEVERQRHAEDAKHLAEEGQRYRATQAPVRGDETDEYDDEEIDELFRRTVAGGLSSGQTTPRRRGMNGSVTPSGSSGAMESRRWRRDQRMREQAGLGDLR